MMTGVLTLHLASPRAVPCPGAAGVGASLSA
jgi:hypothetical protein